MLEQLGHLWNMLTHHGRQPFKGVGKKCCFNRVSFTKVKNIILDESSFISLQKMTALS